VGIVFTIDILLERKINTYAVIIHHLKMNILIFGIPDQLLISLMLPGSVVANIIGHSRGVRSTILEATS